MDDSEHRQVLLSLGNDVRLSLVQGRGTYSNPGTTCEAAIIECGEVHEPCGWCTAAELVKVIRKAQRIAKKRGIKNDEL
jgi:hypothetical protein